MARPKALVELEGEGPSALGAFDPRYEYFYSHMEQWLIEHAGEEIAGEINIGRTRPEPLTRMALRLRLLDLTAQVADLADTLLDLAAKGRLGDPGVLKEQVARMLVSVAVRPRRQAIVGGFGILASLVYPLMPALVERIAEASIRWQHFRDEHQPPTSGNIFVPSPEGTGQRGGWLRPGMVLARSIPDPAGNR